MSQRWSLDELYASFEDQEFKEDFKDFKDRIEELKEWADSSLTTVDQPVKKAEEFINLLRDYQEKLTLLMSFARLKLSVKADNHQAASTVEQLEDLQSEVIKPRVQFQRWWGDLEDLNTIISKSELLKEHEFFLKELAEKSKYLLSNKEEVLAAKMSTTGAKAWYKLQQKLTSTLMVEITIEGEKKKLPLSRVRNMAYNKDPKRRKKAYKAEIKAYEKIEDSTASCLNAIKGEALTLAEKRGYNSPLEKSLFDSRMDKKALEAVLTAIEESLPTFHKYYQKKAELLGHDDELPFYDLFAPLGEESMEFTYEEAREFIVNNFATFNSQLAEYADKAFANNWIDTEPREGKRGGAFCANIHPIKESRILANFDGSFSNVSTLAHELGHGYHGECLKEESILNTNYPMPLAETASIFCQTIIEKAALEKAGKKESLGILENALAGAGQVIVDIYSRYLFESKVFDRRKESSLSVNELKELMLECQKEAYGKGLNHEYLHPYMWICKVHYYIPEFDFYNYPYVFGLLFGKGIYVQYLEEKEAFIKKYDDLLAATGKKKVAEVAKMMGVDIYSTDFWRNSLDLIEGEIKQFIELSEDLYQGSEVLG